MSRARVSGTEGIDRGRPSVEAIHQAVAQVAPGKAAVLDRLLCALLTGGHVLLQDVPGVGKTLLAKVLARAVDLSFSRIQCTPDLMPVEVMGATVYEPGDASLRFRPGPVFANLILVDEINRCSPRTQSALLEAMGEAQVTVDGTRHPLPQPFLVIGTENPLDAESAFPLPCSQLDRFMFRLQLGYPSFDEQVAVLQAAPADRPAERVAQVLDRPALLASMSEVRRVHVARGLARYVTALVEATRAHPSVQVGASPRAAALWMRAAQARAWLRGRSFVIPDDVRDLAEDVLAHRLILRPNADPQAALVRDVVRSVQPPLGERE